MSDDRHPLIASRLTPVGRGAVATIRVRGDFADPDAEHVVSKLNSLLIAANGISLCNQPVGKIAFGRWGWVDPEELVVCRLDKSTLEIHCHGGEAAIQRILADLSECGCIITGWRESTSSKDDFLDVECLEALTLTSTWRTTKIVLEQTNGLLKNAFQQRLQLSLIDHGALDKTLDELLKWAEFGLHLTMPWSVVLTGRPNVGKSSLINALLGYQRAIVFDQPGTTRDVVTGETAFEGWPVILADTAGIRDSSSPLEAAGIRLAQEKLRSADLKLILIDVSQPPTPEDFSLMAQWPDAIVVAHKSDLPHCWHEGLPANAIAVSSVTGEGLQELQKQIVRRLIPEIPVIGTPIPLTQRQVDRLREARAATSVDARKQALKQLIEPNT